MGLFYLPSVLQKCLKCVYLKRYDKLVLNEKNLRKTTEQVHISF